jgi:hypothetical protein
MDPWKSQENNMHTYDQAKPIMYRVRIVIAAPLRKDTILNFDMKQEDLDKTIGRYTRKYGPPINMSEGNSGMTTLDFYSKESHGVWEVNVDYELIEQSSIVTVDRKEATPSVPPPPPPEQIKALLDAEAITSVNKWGH